MAQIAMSCVPMRLTVGAPFRIRITQPIIVPKVRAFNAVNVSYFLRLYKSGIPTRSHTLTPSPPYRTITSSSSSPPPSDLRSPPTYPSPIMPQSSSSSDSVDWNELPTSVRGAPPELRRLIRKKQNSESAKRCRQRRKLEKRQDVSTASSHAAQMRALEAVVVQLSSRLSHMQAVVSSLLASSNGNTPLPPPTPTSPVSRPLDIPHQPGSPVTPPRALLQDNGYSFFADTVDELALS